MASSSMKQDHPLVKTPLASKVHIQACQSQHLAGITDIYNHYISNSIATFDTEARNVKQTQEVISECTITHDLPFLVATKHLTKQNQDSPDTQTRIPFYSSTHFQPSSQHDHQTVKEGQEEAAGYESFPSPSKLLSDSPISIPPPSTIPQPSQDAAKTVDGNEEVVGFTYAHPYHSRPAYASTVEISVYIAPEQVEKGIGRKICEDLVRQLSKIPAREGREHGVREVIVRCARDGDDGTGGFFEDVGFRMVGRMRRVGRKMGRWIDVDVLQMSLHDD